MHISQTILCSFLLEIVRFGSNVVWHCTKISLMICFFEAGEHNQLGTSCAFESPTLANEMSLRGVKCVCRINPVWV